MPKAMGYVLLSVSAERRNQERPCCTLRCRRNLNSSNWAAGLATLKQVLAPSSMPFSVVAFLCCISRYRNQRSWLARCSVAEGGGNNKERDVTFLVSELMERMRDESNASPHAYGERMGEGEIPLSQPIFKLTSKRVNSL